MLAEIYCNMLNSQGFDWICNPAGTELEAVVMRWLGKLLGLDDVFDSEKSKGCGSIHSTASEATLVSMAAARNKTINLLKSKGELNESDEMNTEKLILYCSDQVTHIVCNNDSITNTS
jgi:glutamate/tyrosine decarboxylase-like PLP-dependent enzyme